MTVRIKVKGHLETDESHLRIYEALIGDWCCQSTRGKDEQVDN
jgi:hypothetical protein